MRSVLFILLLLGASSLSAQPAKGSVIGRWTTNDDNTGKPRSVVEITLINGKLSGRIVDLYDKTRLEKLCDKCTGDRMDQKIVGLEIIRDMRPTGTAWDDGTILDPENGKVYDCKLWLEDGKLQVRGYIAFFYRTQTWLRVP